MNLSNAHHDPSSDGEQGRLAALRELEVLDSQAEAEFDALVHAASLVAGAPISLISLVDEHRQWFKASVGLGDVRETPRDQAFCAHTILGTEPMEVTDAATHPTFQENPLVTGEPGIRFYCGFPVKLSSGHAVGTLCVIDREPRTLNDKQKEILSALAVTAAAALEGRRAALEVARRGDLLNKAFADLEQVTGDLRSFVSHASHDLSSPLVTIDRLAHWIEEDLPDGTPTEIVENIHFIQSRSIRMQSLLSDLRSYVMAGHDDESPTVVNVEAFVRSTVESIEGASNCTFEFTGKVGHVACQEAQLQLVLGNVVDNAIRFCTEDSPRIRISAERIDGTLCFEVEDSGPGIKARDQAAVFEPLKTLHSKDQAGGSGIGLALVKKLVEAGGGDVSLISDGASGTTVAWTWPAAEFVDSELLLASDAA